MEKRKKLLLGILILSFIEIIYFYFRGKQYNWINGLGEMATYVIVGNIAFFIAYFVLIEQQQFRKKDLMILLAFVLLLVAPFIYEKDIPKVNVEDAQALIVRTEGGKVVKDREYSDKIFDYEGTEVYLIAVEKKDVLHRYAFNPYTEKYYPFSN